MPGFNDNSNSNYFVRTIPGVSTPILTTADSRFGNGSGRFGETEPTALTVSEVGIGTSAFTIEFWAKHSQTGTNLPQQDIVSFGSSTNAGICGWLRVLPSTGQLIFGTTNAFGSSSTQIITTNAFSYSPLQWNHIAISRGVTGTTETFALHINGVLVAAANSSPITEFPATLVIGSNTKNVVGLYFSGFIDDFRLTLGTARYGTTSNFVLPIQQHAKPTDLFLNNVSLLLPGDGTPKDFSPNNLTLSAGSGLAAPILPGSSSNRPFQAIAPSLNFNSVNNKSFVRTPTAAVNSPAQLAGLSLGTQNFTIEFWINPVFGTLPGTIIETRAGVEVNDRYAIATSSGTTTGTVQFFDGRSGVWAARLTSTTLNANQWYHIAITRTVTAGVGTLRMFVNGTLVPTTFNESTTLANYAIGANRPMFGAYQEAGTTGFYTGLINNFRITKNVVRYADTGFVPPSVPFGPRPTPVPTATPTPTPSASPTPTPTPSASPTRTPTPSASPTRTPTPSASPTRTPTPSASPTLTPTSSPTRTPTPSASPTRTPTPSASPTRTPTPSASPTATPTPTPTPTTGALPATAWVSRAGTGYISGNGLPATANWEGVAIADNSTSAPTAYACCSVPSTSVSSNSSVVYGTTATTGTKTFSCNHSFVLGQTVTAVSGGTRIMTGIVIPGPTTPGTNATQVVLNITGVSGGNVGMAYNNWTLTGNAISGKVYRTTTGGTTWTDITPSGEVSPSTVKSIACDDTGNYVTVCYYGGYLYTSSNSGNNWSVVSAAGARNWYDVHMSNNGAVQIALVYGGLIYRSTDFGATWVNPTTVNGVAGTSATGNWVAVDVAPGGNAVVGSNGGQILKSLDTGDTWTLLSSSPSGSWYSLGASSGVTNIIGSAVGIVVHISTDGGATWAARTLSGASAVFGVAITSNGTTMLAITNNGVYQSTNSGLTFSLLSTSGIPTTNISPYANREIEIQSYGAKAIAALFGGNIYTSP